MRTRIDYVGLNTEHWIHCHCQYKSFWLRIYWITLEHGMVAARIELNVFRFRKVKVMKWSIHPRAYGIVVFFFFNVISLPSFSLKSSLYIWFIHHLRIKFEIRCTESSRTCVYFVPWRILWSIWIKQEWGKNYCFLIYCWLNEWSQFSLRLFSRRRRHHCWIFEMIALGAWEKDHDFVLCGKEHRYQWHFFVAKKK